MKTKYFSPWVLWIVLLIGAVVCLVWLPSDNVYPPNAYIAILLIPAIINWMYVIISAARAHPEAGLSPEKVTQLIQTGIYGRMRHPMYLADIVLIWVVWLFLPQLRLLVFASWLTLAMAIWLLVEERVLRRKFGQEHADYAARVPMIIPRIGRKS
jgi:protein-S-isoprenylcysteine O-methyltransferase Ste14